MPPTPRGPDCIYGGETGRPVGEKFEYCSETNERWLDRSQLQAMLK